MAHNVSRMTGGVKEVIVSIRLSLLRVILFITLYSFFYFYQGLCYKMPSFLLPAPLPAPLRQLWLVLKIGFHCKENRNTFSASDSASE